jgi:hypothetical protein
MINDDIPERIWLRFRQVAEDMCEKSDLVGRERARTLAYAQKQLGEFWREGVNQNGLEPEAAGDYALDLFRPDSFVERVRQPAGERLLFSDRCGPVRWFLITVAVLTGMDACFRSDGFKSGRELGWVQRVIDLVRCIISSIGGLCFLTEILAFLGLRQKSRALYRRGSELLLCTLGGKGVEIAVPIGLAFLFIVMIAQHGGFPPAGNADRFIAVDSSRPTGNATTDRRISGEVRGGSTVVKDETPASERKPSDGTVVADNTVASSTTPVETGSPSFVKEPGAAEVFNWSASLGTEAGLGIVPASSEISGGNVVGSSTLPTKDGTTISTAEPNVNEASGGSAPFANASSGAVELAGGKIAGGIADSPGSAGLVVPYLQPAVPKAGQTPLAPATGLRIVSISP